MKRFLPLLVAVCVFAPQLTFAAEYNVGDACSASGNWQRKNTSNGYQFIVCDGTDWTLSAEINFSSNNTAFGNDAMNSITTGTDNVAIGSNAAGSLDTMTSVVAIGSNALAVYQNLGNVSPTAVGKNALDSYVGRSGGWGPTALGNNAMAKLTTGSRNTAIGRFAGDSLTTGDNNTLVGDAVGQYGTNGSDNTAIGRFAIFSAGGNENTAIGSDALYGSGGTARTIHRNTALGYRAGQNVTTGSNNNLFLGYQAGDLTTTGTDNIIIGYNTDASSATASNELNIGNALTGTIDVSSPFDSSDLTVNGNLTVTGTCTGCSGGGAIDDLSDAHTDYVTDYNLYMGDSAGVSSSPGQYNVALGQNALGSLNGTCGGGQCDQNLAIGYNALSAATTGYMNIAIGYPTLTHLTTGYRNIAIGPEAADSMTNGFNNTAIGKSALNRLQGGDKNVAVGNGALQDNVSGDGNVAIGGHSGGVEGGSLDQNKGSYNVGIGYLAGHASTTGSNNILIGYGADVVSATASDYLNIGNTIFGDMSGAANDDSGTAKVGINNTTPTAALDVIGDIHYTGVLVDVSDIRMKANIAPLHNALEKLSSLHGFSFTMKDNPSGQIEYGVSAQDVQKAFPDLVYKVDSDGTLGVSYSGLIAPLIEASKELDAENKRLRDKVEALEARMQALETRHYREQP
ncbi:MAG: tail fiber domain-containing protein [Rhizobiaceae bacterium]|nr:tail fiber domain-containing protein [Rhizobiaceae bacterium]